MRKLIAGLVLGLVAMAAPAHSGLIPGLDGYPANRQEPVQLDAEHKHPARLLNGLWQQVGYRPLDVNADGKYDYDCFLLRELGTGRTALVIYGFIGLEAEPGNFVFYVIVDVDAEDELVVLEWAGDDKWEERVSPRAGGGA